MNFSHVVVQLCHKDQTHYREEIKIFDKEVYELTLIHCLICIMRFINLA